MSDGETETKKKKKKKNQFSPYLRFSNFLQTCLYQDYF